MRSTPEMTPTSHDPVAGHDSSAVWLLKVSLVWIAERLSVIVDSVTAEKVGTYLAITYTGWMLFHAVKDRYFSGKKPEGRAFQPTQPESRS